MTLTVRGVPYHIVLDGEPARGRPIVLLHGFNGSSEDWTPLLPRLREAGRAAVLYFVWQKTKSEQSFEMKATTRHPIRAGSRTVGRRAGAI